MVVFKIHSWAKNLNRQGLNEEEDIRVDHKGSRQVKTNTIDVLKKKSPNPEDTKLKVNHPIFIIHSSVKNMYFIFIT